MGAVTASQLDSLVQWASGKPRIRRVTLFGNRVKGTYREDSDLDIAVELEPGDDSNATLAVWMHFSDMWKKELESFLPFPVDLQWRDVDGTTTYIDKGLSDACEPIYEKAS